MKRNCRVCFPSFAETRFWENCSHQKGILCFLLLLLLLGVAGGAAFALGFGLFEGQEVFPLFFSGIPGESAGFLSCFTTLLLNLLIFLLLSFLFGLTAFGGFVIPLLTAFKGMTVGLGVSSFLWTDGLSGLGRSALSYTPAAAASLLLFLLFSLRALVFSNRLRRAGFSSREERLDFRAYGKDLLLFLCLSVIVSLLGGMLASLSSVFLLQ